MKIQLPPPLLQPPPPRGFWQDLRLLTATQLRLTWNKIRHWSAKVWIFFALIGLGFGSILIGLGFMAFGALASMTPEIARGFLSIVFMISVAAQVFFGITAAFATLYMSEDLELLFMAPISTRAVFAVKTLMVAASNLVSAFLFALLPSVFYGLLFGVPWAFYFWALLITVGLVAIGTALAELVNMVIMRIVPPHRSKEAVGFIGAVSGILIALIFQIPNMVISNSNNINLGDWLASQDQLLRVMDYFPWGWSSLALVHVAQGRYLPALGWTLPILALGAGVFALAFLLVERGFRRGWISLSQGEGGRRKRGAPTAKSRSLAGKAELLFTATEPLTPAPPWHGMWAVAKKDLLYMKRDTREWFGYLTPLLLMAFFIARALFFPGPGAQQTLIMILIMYTIMFSGNMALQAFGREGESDWLLNSVPLAGWPVVWGKLIATVLPTLVLMEALLLGTGLAIGLAPNILVALALGAVLISVGSSAIGLYYSVNNSRYNPDTPQHRISPGASLLMYLINLLFIGLLAICLVYAFPPEGLLDFARDMPRIPFAWGFPEILLYFLSLIAVPLRWPASVRISFGLLVTAALWAVVFYSFMKATVNQTRKGYRVELVTRKKK